MQGNFHWPHRELKFLGTDWRRLLSRFGTGISMKVFLTMCSQCCAGNADVFCEVALDSKKAAMLSSSSARMALACPSRGDDGGQMPSSLLDAKCSRIGGRS